MSGSLEITASGQRETDDGREALARRGVHRRRAAVVIMLGGATWWLPPCLAGAHGESVDVVVAEDTRVPAGEGAER